MTAGDIPYEHNLWIQKGDLVSTLTTGSSVSAGDILIPGYDVDNTAGPIAVAAEDGDEGDTIRVVVSGLVRVPTGTVSAEFTKNSKVTFEDGDLSDDTAGNAVEAENAVVMEDVATDADDALIYIW